MGFLLFESSFVVLGVFWVLIPFTFLCCRVSVSSANAVPLTEERIKAIASTLGEEGGAQMCCFVSFLGENYPQKTQMCCFVSFWGENYP